MNRPLRPILSEPQAKVLAFVKHYMAMNGDKAPSLGEITEALDYKSESSATVHLNSLAAKGYILRDNKKNRGITLLDGEGNER